MMVSPARGHDPKTSRSRSSGSVVKLTTSERVPRAVSSKVNTGLEQRRHTQWTV